jgi:hypothetical protein
LICKWPFRKIIILYSEIIYIRTYKIPKKTFKVFGIPLINVEYHNQDIGKFLAMYAGIQEGFLIELDNEKVFGGQLFITPNNQEVFAESLQKRSGLSINKVYL